MSFEPVQSLWVGDRLSTMEWMCVRSFQRLGHEFHLYTYQPDVQNVPSGTVLKDATKIVPGSDIYKFQTLANFSDWWRYHMLLQNGGYWVDLDVFALQAFNFPEPYVFSSQLVCERTQDEINAGVIKVPAHSEVMKWCIEHVKSIDLKKCEWPALGPATLMEAMRKFNLQQYVKPHKAFCPLNFFDAPAVIFAPAPKCFAVAEDKEGVYAIHLWNEEARRKNIDKDGSFPGSVYEQLQEMVK